MSQPTREGLIRGIRRWDFVALVVNAIIGAGIFGLPAKVYGLIGSYSLIAFAVCALVVTLIILCFAEVGSRFDATGGPYLFTRAAFGEFVGFEVGWMQWFSRASSQASIMAPMAVALGYYVPGKQHIMVRRNAQLQMTKTLAHELGHHFGGIDDTTAFENQIRHMLAPK